MDVITTLRAPGTRKRAIPAAFDGPQWESNRVYAIAFDLNQAALRRHYPSPHIQGAYDDIRRELEAHRFSRQQGSVYFGGPGTNSVSCVLAVQAIEKRHPWFRHVVDDIRMLRIEEHNDLMPALGQGELPLSRTEAA